VVPSPEYNTRLLVAVVVVAAPLQFYAMTTHDNNDKQELGLAVGCRLAAGGIMCNKERYNPRPTCHPPATSRLFF
jgi:hypothetical protein